jgi:hypothetical protein
MNPPKHGRRAAAPAPARFRTRLTRKAGVPRADRSTTKPTPRVSRHTVRTSAIRPAFSMLAMTFVGGMMIATSVPAHAITATESDPRASVYAPVDDTISLAPQQLTVASEAEVEPFTVPAYSADRLAGRERRQRVAAPV